MRKALEYAGVSTQEMADYLEVTRQSIGNWVGDRRVPSKATVRLWALETGKAPTLPSGPGPYTTRDSNPEPADLESRRDELAARRTARSAFEVEQVAA